MNSTKYHKAQNFKVIDHYVLSIKEILGTGSYGSVYRGLDVENKTSVAIKQVTFSKKSSSYSSPSSQMTQALYNEITNMRLIDHINVVKLYDVKKSSNNFYLICEYCSQGNLEVYITSKGGQLSIKESLRFIRDIVSGFKCLYNKNIVHRDLKPANLLLHKNRLKIADFGFSKLVDHAMESQQILSQVGSPLYMSPQILRGDSYSSKTDIWSLGVLFFQMIYGSTPWKGKSSFNLLKEIENTELFFPEIPQVSSEIKGLIEGMLKLDEEERFSWDNLFEIRLLEEELENSFNLEKSLCELEAEYKQDEFLKYKALNLLYFQQNKVVQIPYEEDEKEERIIEENYEKIIEKQIEKEKKWVVIKGVSSWVLHKRNKIAFLSLFCLKLLELLMNKTLVLRSEIYHRFMFLGLKMQMMVLYKLYMRLKIGDSVEFKHFSSENWKLFIANPAASAILKIVTTDLTIVKTFFTRCLEQTISYIASKTKNEEVMGKLKGLKTVCDNNLGDKKMFETVFNEMLKDFAGYFYAYLKKNGLENQKELLEFGYLLKILFNRKNVFRWKAEEPLDFLKLYEDIANCKINSIKDIFSLEN